jgi:hypothetical protein
MTLSAPSEMSFAGDFVAVGYPSCRLVLLAVASGTVRWTRRSPRRGAPRSSGWSTLGATGHRRRRQPHTGPHRLLEVGGQSSLGPRISAGAGLGADANRVYGVDAKSHVAAFASSTGANAWRQKIAESRPDDAARLRRAVLVSDYASYLHSSPEDGSWHGFRWAVKSMRRRKRSAAVQSSRPRMEPLPL